MDPFRLPTLGVVALLGRGGLVHVNSSPGTGGGASVTGILLARTGIGFEIRSAASDSSPIWPPRASATMTRSRRGSRRSSSGRKPDRAPSMGLEGKFPAEAK